MSPSPTRIHERGSMSNVSTVTDILQHLTGLVPSATSNAAPPGARGTRAVAAAAVGGTCSASAFPEARKRAYLRAAVRVLRRNTLGMQVPPNVGASGSAIGIAGAGSDGGSGETTGARIHGEVAMRASGRGAKWRDALPPLPLAEVSVRLLLKELNDIVDPPRRLPRFKIHLRRAPTQEVCLRPLSSCDYVK